MCPAGTPQGGGGKHGSFIVGVGPAGSSDNRRFFFGGDAEVLGGAVAGGGGAAVFFFRGADGNSLFTCD